MEEFVQTLKVESGDACAKSVCRLIGSNLLKLDNVDHQGRNCLFLACLHNQLEVVQYLLGLVKSYRDIHCDYEGRTPLMISASLGATDIVKVLLNTFPLKEIRLKDHMGNTAFIHAAIRGHLQILTLLIIHDNEQPNDTEYTGKHALMFAVLEGHVDVVKWLVPITTCLDSQDFSGNTILHYAVKRGNISITSVLLCAHCKTTIANFDGIQPLSIACDRGDTEAVKLLLVHGADLKTKDFHGYTPLMHAVFSGNILLVNYLISEGADINCATNDGKSCAVLALENKSTKLVEHLINRGIDLSKKDFLGNSFLHHAVINNSKDALLLCIHKGANLNSQNFEGKSPLILAAMNGNIEIVNILLQYRALIDLQDYSGSTALMWSVWNGYIGVVKRLILAGSDVNAVDFYGKSSLILASMKGSVAGLKLLLNNGAKINTRDHLGFDALTYANDMKSRKAYEILEAKFHDVDAKNPDISSNSSHFKVALAEEATGAFNKYDLDKETFLSFSFTEERERIATYTRESLSTRFESWGVLPYPIAKQDLSDLGKTMQEYSMELRVHIFDCFSDSRFMRCVEKFCSWCEQFPCVITKDLAPHAQVGASCGIVAAFAQVDMFCTYLNGRMKWFDTSKRKLDRKLCEESSIRCAQEIVNRKLGASKLQVFDGYDALSDVAICELVTALLQEEGVDEESRGGIHPPMSIDYVALNISKYTWKQVCCKENGINPPDFWICNTENFDHPGKESE